MQQLSIEPTQQKMLEVHEKYIKILSWLYLGTSRFTSMDVMATKPRDHNKGNFTQGHFTQGQLYTKRAIDKNIPNRPEVQLVTICFVVSKLQISLQQQVDNNFGSFFLGSGIDRSSIVTMEGHAHSVNNMRLRWRKVYHSILPKKLCWG